MQFAHPYADYPGFAAGHPRPFWRINRKETEGLFKFDGEDSNYRAWKSRIRDHASETWPVWRNILDDAENARHEMSFDKLATVNVHGDDWH